MSNKPDSEVSNRKFADRLERQANDGHGWNKVPGMLREAAKRIRAFEPPERIGSSGSRCLRCGAGNEWIEGNK